jgi:hypothetical protein
MPSIEVIQTIDFMLSLFDARLLLIATPEGDER